MINNIRDYEKFLHANGFSRTEAKTLARAWKDLDRLTFWEKIKGWLCRYAPVL